MTTDTRLPTLILRLPCHAVAYLRRTRLHGCCCAQIAERQLQEQQASRAEQADRPADVLPCSWEYPHLDIGGRPLGGEFQEPLRRRPQGQRTERVPSLPGRKVE